MTQEIYMTEDQYRELISKLTFEELQRVILLMGECPIKGVSVETKRLINYEALETDVSNKVDMFRSIVARNLRKNKPLDIHYWEAVDTISQAVTSLALAERNANIEPGNFIKELGKMTKDELTEYLGIPPNTKAQARF